VSLHVRISCAWTVSLHTAFAVVVVFVLLGAAERTCMWSVAIHAEVQVQA
jgi:hypothetical protein